MPSKRIASHPSLLGRLLRRSVARRLSVLLVVVAACGERAPEPGPPTAPTAPDASRATTADASQDVEALRAAAIDNALKAVTDRQACNRVTGCPGATVLLQFGADLIEPAAQALARPDRGDNFWTIVLPEVLGQVRDARATAPLVKLLSDRKWEVRIAAAIGLGHLGELASAATPELERLIALPDNEPGAGGDLAFRAALEFAAMRVDPAHAAAHREVLKGLMPPPAIAADTPPPILDVLVALIGHARLSEALPTVRAGLASGNRFVVATALATTGKLQDNGAIPQLITLTADANPTIRKLAFGALADVTGASFDTTEQWRAWAERVGVPGL